MGTLQRNPIAKPEQGALIRPGDGQFDVLEHFESQAGRLATADDGGLDVRGEERQFGDTAKIRVLNAARAAINVGAADRGNLMVPEHFVRTLQSLEQGRIRNHPSAHCRAIRRRQPCSAAAENRTPRDRQVNRRSLAAHLQ